MAEEEIKQAPEKVAVIEEKTQAEEFEEERPEEKKKQKERNAVLYINTSKNNTILTLTDMAGNTLLRASGGQSTKQARLKSSPTVAMFSAKKIAEEAKELGITGFYIRIRGTTGGQSSSSAAHAIVKTLGRDDFRIVSILETTRMPRGGPKAPGGRRGRRV
jgi:small subunit ribosomal protein S11